MNGNKMNLVGPNIPQQPPQTMVVVDGNTAKSVQDIVAIIDSAIEYIDKNIITGFADAVTMGIAKRFLFGLLNMKKQPTNSLQQAQVLTDKLEDQKKLIKYRWGNEVLVDMMAEYESTQQGGVQWEQVN